MITKEIKIVLRAVKELLKLVYTNKILAYADLITHNIYVLQVKHLLTLNKMTNLVKLWHWQLAHIRYSNISKLKNISTDLKDINVTSSKEICDSCIKDCQKKSSFNHQSYNREIMTKTTKFLQRIHTNLKEPLSSTCYDHIYYILFTDDWSNMIKIYIMKFKIKAYNMFKTF